MNKLYSELSELSGKEEISTYALAVSMQGKGASRFYHEWTSERQRAELA